MRVAPGCDQAQRRTKAHKHSPVMVKAVREMQAVAAAIIYDGRIDDMEIHLLREWLNKHNVASEAAPLSELVAVVQEIVEDGIVTDQERMLLLDFLSNFASATQQPEVIRGIFDEGARIDFAGRSFKFTGMLSFGTRRRAEAAVQAMGGTIAVTDGADRGLNYLVVGGMDGEDVQNVSLVADLDVAIKSRKAGNKLPLIVREKEFIGAVIRANPALG